ncbi:YihY/virulence factor BrkB family protein [Persicimonas caeni]|uniref:YihY/virulence factor BrkB family protein n=1 Tax=Persicimonas caeni TaxID=2292766 RepID=A0A4Y6PMZ5_PERCE|nr:YihY/virulence factor BrkB family protein [Persicimonas caeni]QDG49671.1 YihY/virulence factor BrkB family protein [Persicimonas caeni]QED30892.1 YihY/virulence factor BrkB family protein [Persicimonas caeni]
MGRAKKGFETLKKTFQEWKEDDAQTWAASVAFYTMFSLAPLLVLAVALASFIFGERAARGELVTQMETMVGPGGAETIQTILANASGPGGGGVIATIISVALLLLGASKVFGELQKAMNRIWDVRSDPNEGWRGAARKRLTGFAMVLGIGLFLLAAIAASTFLSNIQQFVGEVPGGPVVWTALNFVVSLLIIGFLFAALFKYVPDVEIEWSDVWFGAGITAALFALGKLALGIYLSHASVGSAYGAAGSLVVLLAWIFYSAQIFFFGAEYTQVHAKQRGRSIQPNEHAIHESEFEAAQPSM